MRHRFHSICPYFAMFPESFVEQHLAATQFNGVVFDPFCGRGTTVLESLIRGRRAAGCDVHPVAVCVSGAKSDPPTREEVIERLSQLEEGASFFEPRGVEESMSEFFDLCFEAATYRQICYLKEQLNWKNDRTDRFIAALCLGSLHGESHRSPNYFSNRMPRTISTKPRYSIQWWRKNGYRPPVKDVFAILRRRNDYRFGTPPPKGRGEIAMSDARDAAHTFSHLLESVSDIITSPPYLDTTNYREDQWLRLWFLGEGATANYTNGDDRHSSTAKYWRFLTEAWMGISPLLARKARIVVRIGGRKLTGDEIKHRLKQSLEVGLNRNVHPTDDGVSSTAQSTQANTFRGPKATPAVEYDFCFLTG